MKKNNEHRLIRGGIWICTILAVVLVIGGFYAAKAGFVSPRANPVSDRMSDLGNYGSFLQGTTASLWSLAGLLIIFVAFLAQKQQLLLQQEQFERQSFESSFFQLLSLHNQIVLAMRDVDVLKGYTEGEHEAVGRDCFERWYREFKTGLWGVVFGEEDAMGAMSVVAVPKSVTEKYLAFYNHHQGVLGHYFRNLYHVIKFVKESPTVEKRRYTSLVRAQLSQYELAMLFYNGLTAIPPEPTNKFKPLIEEFGLLENFNRDLLLDSKDIELYAAGAFK